MPKETATIFVAYQDHLEIDLSSHDGKLRLAMLAWVAEFERRRISERVKMGLRAARASGKRLCRPALTVNEEKVRADYARLKSLRGVARRHHCSTWLGRQIRKERRGFSGERGISPVERGNIPGEPGKIPPERNRKQDT